MVNTHLNYTYKTDIELEFNKLWSAFKRRWRVGLFVMVSSVLLSAIAASNEKPEYTATGKLLFKINRAAALAGIGEEINNMAALERNANPVITEIEVVKSMPIAEQAIDNLKKSNSVGSFLSAEKVVNKLSVEPIVGTDIVTVSYSNDNSNQGVKGRSH